MGTRLTMLICCLALIYPAMALVAGQDSDPTKDPTSEPTVKAVVELSDGSRLVGTPTQRALKVQMEFAAAQIPLEMVRQCEVLHSGERVVLHLNNGDKLTATLENETFGVKTVLGQLTPALAQIEQIRFTAQGAGAMPAGDGRISFGGVNWLAWKTLFEIRGDKLVSLPQARPGFNYGHNGNGRGPTLMTNIGNPDWKDYSIEVDLCMTGVDPALNPYGLPLDWRGGAIFFRVADTKESFNERGSSMYILSLSADGTWNLSCAYNSYCRVPVGWGEPVNDGERELVQGAGLRLDPREGNRFRIDVVGTRIQVWVDGQQIADLHDEKMREPIGGQTLDHGGVGFHWGFDSMGWIRNFSAKPL